MSTHRPLPKGSAATGDGFPAHRLRRQFLRYTNKQNLELIIQRSLKLTRLLDEVDARARAARQSKRQDLPANVQQEACGVACYYHDGTKRDATPTPTKLHGSNDDYAQERPVLELFPQVSHVCVDRAVGYSSTKGPGTNGECIMQGVSACPAAQVHRQHAKNFKELLKNQGSMRAAGHQSTQVLLGGKFCWDASVSAANPAECAAVWTGLQPPTTTLRDQYKSCGASEELSTKADTWHETELRLGPANHF